MTAALAFSTLFCLASMALLALDWWRAGKVK